MASVRVAWADLNCGNAFEECPIRSSHRSDPGRSPSCVERGAHDDFGSIRRDRFVPMRMNGDFAFKSRANFVGHGCMIQIRGRPQIDKKFATVRYLIASESTSDLRYLCAGCT